MFLGPRGMAGAVAGMVVVAVRGRQGVAREMQREAGRDVACWPREIRGPHMGTFRLCGMICRQSFLVT